MKTYLKHKDGSRQEVRVIYGSFTEEGGGSKLIVHQEPMSVVQLVGVDLKHKWSIKTVPTRFIEQETL